MRREHSVHTEHLEGKWSYCAARMADAKQGMKKADFLPFYYQILAFNSLQPGWSPAAHLTRGTPTKHRNFQTKVPSHLSTAQKCTPSLVPSDITIVLGAEFIGQLQRQTLSDIPEMWGEKKERKKVKPLLFISHWVGTAWNAQLLWAGLHSRVNLTNTNVHEWPTKFQDKSRLVFRQCQKPFQN